MKKFIALLLIIISNATFAQNCNIGNEDTTGFDNSADPAWANYLLGVKFNLPINGTLNSLNLIGRNTGANVQMALYNDNNGVPGNLIISSNIGIVSAGVVSLSVSSTQLLAGNYWIMAIYDIVGGHIFNTTSDIGNIVYYTSLTFGDTIPTNASNFMSYSNHDLTYFAEISCGSVGISELNEPADVSFYPNPASNLVTINVDKDLIGTTYIITDLLGKQILIGKLNNETSLIDISQLNSGIYLFQVGHQRKQTLKLIKA